MSAWERAARFLLSAAVAHLPKERREWCEAMRTEAGVIDDDAERARWLASAAWGAWRLRLAAAMPRLLIPAVALVAAVVVLDRSPSDVANQATLALLLAGSAALAFANPHAVRVITLAVGLTVPIAHSAYLLAGAPLPYQTRPAGWAGPATLLLLVIPVCVSALAGAALRRRSPRA